MIKEKQVYRLKEVSEKYDIPVTRLTLAIRNGEIKAVKSGKEYLVTPSEIHKYLGIDTTNEGITRELYIKELENKIKIYEAKINMLKNCISMMQDIFRDV
ncbi:MAG TPA: DNA-binding protein [Clostridium sp.]|nr:DNA-binding protein [Clostridium sp.]